MPNNCSLFEYKNNFIKLIKKLTVRTVHTYYNFPVRLHHVKMKLNIQKNCNLKGAKILKISDTKLLSYHLRLHTENKK